MKKKDGSISFTNTISQLPEHILQHILCFLPQNDAVQTCVLSKSWRHLWSTRSKFEFFSNNFRGSEHQFLSVVDNTLQLYHDQKVSLQDFALGMMMSMVDSESISISLLEKWIPIIAILNKGLMTFTLVLDNHSDYFDLPSQIFKIESIRKLHLKGCKLSQINPLDQVIFKQLKTLHLNRVYIADATLEKIMSSCPLIDFLELCECEGLTSTMKMREHLLFLKYFEFSYYKNEFSIEIDVPTLETIVITNCRNWIRHDKCFPNLKSLCLSRVRLCTDLFDNFSCNFPCVEEMKLHFCYGFQKFSFQSVSIKRLIIEGMEETVNADIDAPNIVEFKYKGRLPWSISFTTTSKEWKSNINLDLRFNCSSWVVRLSVLLEGLSQSEISLDLAQHRRAGDPKDLVVPKISCYTPIVVEHLHLRVSDHSAPNLSAFINTLFCICRPRKICQFWCANPQGELERKHNQIIEFLYNILQMERKEEMRQCSWQQDLQEVSLEEFFDDIDEKWHHVQATSWLEYCASLLPKDFKNGTQQLRFRLKWREISRCLTN